MEFSRTGSLQQLKDAIADARGKAAEDLGLRVGLLVDTSDTQVSDVSAHYLLVGALASSTRQSSSRDQCSFCADAQELLCYEEVGVSFGGGAPYLRGCKRLKQPQESNE